MSDTKTAFVVFFDEQNRNHHRDPVMNTLFLRAVQNYLNNRLILEGFIFLNDVFDQLGMPKTSDGQIYGWFWEKGSTVVDFNTKEDGTQYILTLHPDGIIYEKLP